MSLSGVDTGQVEGGVAAVPRIEFIEAPAAEKDVFARVEETIGQGDCFAQFSQMGEIYRGAQVEQPGTDPMRSWRDELASQGDAAVQVGAGKVVNQWNEGVPNALGNRERTLKLRAEVAAKAENLAMMNEEAAKKLGEAGLVPQNPGGVPKDVKGIFLDLWNRDDTEGMKIYGQVWPVSYGVLVHEAARQMAEQAQAGGKVEEGREKLLKMPGFGTDETGKVGYDSGWRNTVVSPV